MDSTGMADEAVQSVINYLNTTYEFYQYGQYNLVSTFSFITKPNIFLHCFSSRQLCSPSMRSTWRRVHWAWYWKSMVRHSWRMVHCSTRTRRSHSSVASPGMSYSTYSTHICDQIHVHEDRSNMRVQETSKPKVVIFAMQRSRLANSLNPENSSPHSRNICTWANSNRLPLLTISRSDSSGNEYDVLIIDCDNETFALVNWATCHVWAHTHTQTVTEVPGNFWLGGAGPPVNEPVCGFTGSRCDYSPYYYAGGGVVLLIMLIIVGFFIRRS